MLPHHVNDAFYPIVSHIWRAAEFAGEESSGARLEKIEAMARRSRLEPKEIEAYLASGTWQVEIAGKLCPAVVSARPLYDPGMKRIHA